MSEEDKVGKVFVYGSLKQNWWLFKQLGLSKYLVKSQPATVKGVMLHLGEFPGVLFNQGDYLVKGEVHSYREFTLVLKELDRVEGYSLTNPEYSHYVRKKVSVSYEDGATEEVEVYEYNCHQESDHVIPAGEWTQEVWDAGTKDLKKVGDFEEKVRKE